MIASRNGGRWRTAQVKGPSTVERMAVPRAFERAGRRVFLTADVDVLTICAPRPVSASPPGIGATTQRLKDSRKQAKHVDYRSPRTWRGGQPVTTDALRWRPVASRLREWPVEAR